MAEGGGTPLLCPLLGVVIIVVAVVMISKEAVDCERAMVVDVIENNAINSLLWIFLAPSPLDALAHAHAQQNLTFSYLLPPLLRQTETHISRSSCYYSSTYDDEGLHGSSIRQVRASFCSTCFFEVVAIDGV